MILEKLKLPLQAKLQRQYVATLLDIVGRSLVVSSQVDANIQQEIAHFPIGFRFAMNVFATDLAFYAEVTERKQLCLITAEQAKAQGLDLEIRFKHLQHAFLVLSFQESTARAFANDRMVVNGDLSHAVRLVRCLNQLESVILPKLVARLAVKHYPDDLTLPHKVKLASQIYVKVAQSYLKTLKDARHV